MSATTGTSWMPVNGRHRVSVGTSLRRALKTRSGKAATAKRNNLPDRDFYSFRYNFKPPSIDPTKPGSIEVKRSKDMASVMVEHPGSQAGERHIFVGSEQPAKEIDCVLIYDEETGTFTLEKLDSYMALKHERKITDPNVASASSSPLPPTPSTSKQAQRDLDFEAQLERDLLGEDEDADGELDEESASYNISPLKQEMKGEEQDEEPEMFLPVPRRRSPPPKAKPSRPAKAAAKSAQNNTTQPARYKTQTKGKSKAKEKVMALEIEAEDLEFGQPARQAKQIQLSPASPALALPGSSSANHPPSALYASALPSSHKPNVSEPLVISDSEDEWDEVQPNTPGGLNAVDVTDPTDAANVDEDEMEEEEEIDMNAFEEEMNQELNGTEHVSAQPMSLNQFAGGGAEASQDEDDYTSSEDSDED